ncbi:MAG: hypothetical protein WCX74_03605 [Candidatus Paceibacterota bacterium]
MLKKILLVSIVSSFLFVYPVVAAQEENNQDKQKETFHQKIINLWNNDAAPFLNGVVCSFKTDVWEKTTNWLEKNSNKNQNTTQQDQNTGNKEKDKKCTFFDAIHQAFTGKQAE